jgi:Ca2+-binding EF-hand superfamily protein
MRNIDSPQSDNITFKNFIQTLHQLCRSSRADQDKNIFNIFDIRNNQEIGKEEITMMIVNLPDMGFTLSQNVLIPDIQYKHIKDEVLNSIVKQRNIYNYMKFY